MVTCAKLNSVPVIVLINDTQLRDPVYFDYVFNFMQHYQHYENFILFDKEFCDRLADVEAVYIRKLKKVAMPSYDVLWKQAAAKVRKNLHVVFNFTDLTSYKELFQMYPQFEYLTEVMFFDDLSPLGYRAMVDSFLGRSKLDIIDYNDHADIATAMFTVRDKVRQQLSRSFYSQKMLRASVNELCVNFGATEFIFPNDQKVTGNIFVSPSGFHVMDKDMRNTFMNMPLQMWALNKHRYGMFLQLFRYLYDLISMHLSIHKAYYETFIAKTEQFTQYYNSVKRSKVDLHQGATEHTFREM
jgi:hypothetical protein